MLIWCTMSCVAQVMPPELRPHARFVVLLREPSARLLSWYNHRMAQQIREDAQGRACAYCQFCAHGSFFARQPGGFFAVDAGGNQTTNQTSNQTLFRPTFEEDAMCELEKVTLPDSPVTSWYETGAESQRTIPPLNIMRGLLYEPSVRRWSEHFGRDQVLVLFAYLLTGTYLTST